MAYTVTNFKSKKALKEAVDGWKITPRANGVGFYPVRAFQPGLGPDLSNFTGMVALEGPHYPKPHSWYAQAELVNGVVVKVK